VTSTQVVVDLKPPPQPLIAEFTRQHSNTISFTIANDMEIALGAKVFDPDQRLGADVQLVAQRKKQVVEPAYQRLLTDAMHGNKMLFSTQAMVEAMWRIIDPILDSPTPPARYAPGTWGPAEADRMVSHHGGWKNPELS
jgi:glucose-6-phosphate 1-dehydrogenase